MKTTRVGLVTKEWPPQVYGGAGVHAVQLTEALRNLDHVSVDVHCFGGVRADGAFGLGTKRTLLAWQKKNGLTADGIAGPATLKKLFG